MSTNKADTGAHSNVIQLFGPRKVKKNPRRFREIEGQKKLPKRLARLAKIVPKKVGKKCAFSSSCRKECVEPDFIDFVPAAKIDLNIALYRYLEEFNFDSVEAKGRDGENRSKIEIAWDINAILAGAWNPLYKTRCVCGSKEGEGERLMVNFSSAQMREALGHGRAVVDENFNVQLRLSGTYLSQNQGGNPFGLHPQIAELLARIANLSLPDNEKAFRHLIEDGGLHGISTISRMISEPTTPNKARTMYLGALAEIISCVDFTLDGEVEIIDEGLALKLSRFYPEQRREPNGIISSQQYMGSPLPQEPFIVNVARLRQIMLHTIGELFQNVVDLSGRLEEMALSIEEGAVVEQDTINNLYSAMEQSLIMILRKDMPNRSLWNEFVELKKDELAGEDLYPGEQTLATNMAFNIPHDLESLDWESANQFFELLNAATDDAYRYLDALNIDEF